MITDLINIKRKIIFIVPVLFFLLFAYTGITESYFIESKTAVYIIGTVHQNTNNFNSDTLLNIIRKIKPDVILVECDSSYMTTDFKLKEDIKEEFPETKAITDFNRSKNVILRPYDISGRDNFLDDDSRKINERNFFDEISYLSNSNNLNDAARIIINNIHSMMNTADEMSSEEISYINSPAGSSKIDTINYYTYTGIRMLINEIPELSHYKPYWDKEYNFWIKRNNTMIENILGYEMFFKGKKILVMCGFAHKNILKNSLIERSGKNVSVKEYWE